jgi:8-oxo-dGTP diphosphatase
VSPDNSARAIHVVAAAVTDAAGRVLIAQRPPGKHLAGGWEFPGGKLHPGEDRRVGLARELREEIGIEIQTPRPLLRLRHRYDYGEVLLDMWVVRCYSGEARGLDGQALRWCSQDELRSVELLPADKPIVAALRLPERLTEVSTPDYTLHDAWRGPSLDGRLCGVFCSNVRQGCAAAKSGAAFLVMRDELAMPDLKVLCESVDLPVFVRASSLPEAWGRGATGTHDLKALDPHRRNA